MRPTTIAMLVAVLAVAAPAAPLAAQTAPADAKPKASAPRTLEDIRIEGEIPVPQVLFITARDQRRFMELHHHRYLASSRELGERIVFPQALVVIHTPVTGTAKEQSP